MIRYIIVDDETIAHEIIREYCDYIPELELKQQCYNAMEALSYLNQNEVDLIFLDINMPQLSGFDFLRTLIHPPSIIVTTAYKEFAIEGYELNVADYLLKPFSFSRFLQAVNKVVEELRSRRKVNTVTESAKIDSTQTSLFLKDGRKYHKTFIKDILYLVADGNYTKVVTYKKTIMTLEKLSSYLDLLPSDTFMQIHKSYIVAKDKIDTIGSKQIEVGDIQIPIGQTYKNNVQLLLK